MAATTRTLNSAPTLPHHAGQVGCGANRNTLKRLKHPSQPPNFPPTNQILQHRSTLPVDGIHRKRYPIKCIKLTEKGYPSCSGKYRRRLGCYVEVPRQTYANDPIGDQALSLLSGTRRRHALTSLRPLSYAELCAEPGPKTAWNRSRSLWVLKDQTGYAKEALCSSTRIEGAGVPIH